VSFVNTGEERGEGEGGERGEGERRVERGPLFFQVLIYLLPV
jgi:hypothetical protein